MPPRRWYPGSLLLWTYLLVLGSGCASIPLGRWASREREPVISRKTQTASREKNKDDSPRTLLRSKSKSEKSERPPAIADAAAKPPRPLDPATQMLIDSELKSLPTEERQRWKSYLASVEPSKIPNILQSRNAGIIPPEVAESSKESTAASTKKEIPVRNLSRTKRLNKTATDSDKDLDAPDPEFQQIAATETEDAPNDTANPSADIQIALDESEADEPSPADDKLKLTAGTEGEAAATEPPEKHVLDGMKIWQHGKRGERTLSDRLSAGRMPSLTAPWSRDSDAKTLNAKTKNAQRPETPVVTAAVDTPVRTDPKADYWQDELRKLISLMEAEASRPPVDDTPAERQAHIQRQVYLRMLYLMAAEPEKAQLPIADVEAVDQEFWTSMFWGMSNYFDDEQTGDPGTRAAQTIAQLNAAARHLQSVADLELRNVNFCRQIDGWGLYERFDREEFEPGQEVLLYGEIRNFSSEPTATGTYRTLVNSTIEIVRTGQEDIVIERNDLGDTEDQCRGQRTDFYNSYRIAIPPQLAPGSYQLRLSVEDKLSGRIATQTIGFSVR